MNYSWPGNVRELENVIQRAITLGRQDVILPEDLPPPLIQEAEEDLLEKGLKEKYRLDRFEKEYIKRVLKDVRGNKTRAAEILGVDRKTINRKLREEE
jgi:DNA-binding NtrC family response regulator